MSFFIAGDWGTSHLRLYLCRPGAGILDKRRGPGVIEARGNFEATFFRLADDWLARHGRMPVILSGSIGSTLGWHEAPYSECPIEIDELASARVRFERRGLHISILGGLKTINPLGLPDVLRGEELQILGWSRTQNRERAGTRLVALPGTHNKWVVVEGSTVQTFVTAMSGELFALLRERSVLVGDADAPFSEAAFGQGLHVSLESEDEHFLHALFSTRSGALLGRFEPPDAASYLSGVIVGADVRGALAMFAPPADAVVDLIGAPDLCRHYQVALAHCGVETVWHDPDAIATAGYEMVHAAIGERKRA